MNKEVEKPSMLRIPRGTKTERLYRAEERRSRAIQDAAHELSAVLGHDIQSGDFWRRTMPQALFDVLESSDSNASIAAAQAYLERHGFVVTKKTES